MDKNIIKDYLTKAFLTEEAIPGIKVTAAANKESGKINKTGIGAMEKDIKAYDKALKQTDKENKTMGANKFNYIDDAEKTYHDEMETLNGQEMVEYNSEPSEEFTKRAKEGIEGSSRMGNEKGGNAEAAFGASSDDFGKDLVKRIKSSAKKRADAEIQTYGMGDVQIPTGRKVQTSKIGVNENNTEENSISEMGRTANAIKNQLGYGYTHFAIFKSDGKIADGWDYKSLYDKYDKTYDNDTIKYYSKLDLSDNYPENKPSDFKIVTRNFLEKKGINITDINNWFKHGNDNTNTPLENNNNQIKESMKRLKFKKEFNGVGNALKLIPEAYRTDKKEFEMTDGNETYRIRWEGTLTEGRAIILTACDKKMVNEDMQKMKHLMGYKSQDTLGLVKGNARIDENKTFGDIWNKTKILLEGGDIESIKAKEGDLDKVKKHAPEAKKHVEGKVSKEKVEDGNEGKEGSMESLDDAVSHAPEAKKHVEGSVSTEKGTKAPAPKKGEWENVKKKATEATKHVKMNESEEGKEHEDAESTEFEAGENEENKEVTTESSNIEGGSTKKGEWDKIKVPHAAEAKKHIHLKENEEIDNDNDEPEDNYYKGDDEDDDTDVEPTAADIPKDVPTDTDADDEIKVPTPAPKGTSTILFSPSTGEYWLKVGDATTKVPDKFLSIAGDKSIKAYQRAEKIVSLMQDDVDSGIDMDIEDEDEL